MSKDSLVVEGYRQPSRVEALDSARGWAILGVIAIHVSLAVPLPSGILHALVSNGDMGVELFYVLSAFSLTMMLNVRTLADQHSLTGYFIRRFFRIAPMFWIALLIASLLFFGKPTFWSPDGIGWTDVFLTATFLHGIHPDSINSVIPGGWSVAVEVMFYLVLPFLFKSVTTVISAFIWLAVSVAIYFAFGSLAQPHFELSLPERARYLADIYSWYMSFPAQLPVFMMGIVAFLVFKDGLLKPVYAYTIACVGAFLLISMPIQPENHILPRHFLWAVIFAFLIIANVQRPFFLFDNALMRILGRISYSAYLLHFFVLIYVGKIFRHAMIQPEIKFALFYFVVVGITYFLAAWTYRVIELPGMKIGARFSRRFEMSSAGFNKERHEK